MIDRRLRAEIMRYSGQTGLPCRNLAIRIENGPLLFWDSKTGEVRKASPEDDIGRFLVYNSPMPEVA